MEKYILQNGKKYFIHPVYKKYAANEDGEIMNIRLRNPRKGNLINSGYLKCGITTGENKIKSYYSHRFVFECFYGPIEQNKQINHINSIRADNRIKNLEVVNASENCKKAAVNKEIGFYRKKPKKVAAINLFTKSETNFNSLYSVEKMLGIKRAQVSMICRGISKTANSKVDGCKYSFCYI